MSRAFSGQENDAEKTAREVDPIKRWTRNQAQPKKTIYTVLSGTLHCAAHGHKIIAAISRYDETEEIRRRCEAFTSDIDALTPEIEALREKVMHVLDAIGSTARTETIRRFLSSQEEKIRKLRWQQTKLERRRSALQPKPGMIKAVLRIYGQTLAQLRTNPEDRPATLLLRQTIERFDVTGDRQEPVLTVAFNIPGVMTLLEELDR